MKIQRTVDISWQKIFNYCKLDSHDFKKSPYNLVSKEIKEACQDFTKTTAKEVRILCKQDSRESRPSIFKKNHLFLLPTKNGSYAIVRGEGYMDIPTIEKSKKYTSKLQFHLDTVNVGNSEMQHLDFAYATSLVRTFMNDPNLILTIRGRKYTPAFEFYVGKQKITTKSVQTEVDAGYESNKQIVLVEAKNSKTKNTLIRQLYYPYRQWQQHTKKPVKTLFFEKRDNLYSFWLFSFDKILQYNSVRLVKSKSYFIDNTP